MRKYEFCIGGYAGCGNIGDDAILEGYLKGLSPAQRRLKTVVLSGKPKWDSRRFGVRCVGRKNPFSVMASLLQSKVFLCGGGSLLQNATGNPSLFYYLGLLWLARLCGCKTRLMSSGIGPVRGRIAERLVVWALKCCEQIEVRDRVSEHFLLERGLGREKVHLVSDAAEQLELPPASRLTFIKRELGLTWGQNYFCVVVREDGHPFGACLGNLSAALRLFLRQRDLTPVFVLFDKNHDLDATKRICGEVGGVIYRPHEARDALSVISGTRFLVSMRLHALIFASMTGARSIAISPSDEEPKLASFCKKKGMTHFSPAKLTVAGLFEELSKLGECGREGGG